MFQHCDEHTWFCIVGRTRPDLSDKPTIPKPQAVWTAKAVSEEEIEETQKKYDELKFNIETVVRLLHVYESLGEKSNWFVKEF